MMKFGRTRLHDAGRPIYMQPSQKRGKRKGNFIHKMKWIGHRQGIP